MAASLLIWMAYLIAFPKSGKMVLVVGEVSKKGMVESWCDEVRPLSVKLLTLS